MNCIQEALDALESVDRQMRAAWQDRSLPASVFSTDTIEKIGRAITTLRGQPPFEGVPFDEDKHPHWAAIDHHGQIDFAASLGRGFIHDHINDSITHGVFDAEKMVVRAIYVKEETP